jgi:Rap1a immunity proteins
MRTMVSTFVFLSSAITLGFGNVALAAPTAAEILAWCRPDSPKQDVRLCDAYIGAIAEIAARPDRIEDNLGVACIPENVKAEQLSSLVVKKLQPSPELTSTDGFDAIAPIFIEAYPCSP